MIYRRWRTPAILTYILYIILVNYKAPNFLFNHNSKRCILIYEVGLYYTYSNLEAEILTCTVRTLCVLVLPL